MDYADLKEKYNTLHDQLRTTELENQVYEKEITKLQQEIAKLKEENKHHQMESVEFKQVTSPLFTQSMASLSVALEDADALRETVTDENNEYKERINELNHEIDQLKQQNTRYGDTVETLESNLHKTELEYARGTAELRQEIEDIKQENRHILLEYEARSNEYDALKIELETQLKTEMEVHTPSDAIFDDKSLHVKFAKSIRVKRNDSCNGNMEHLMDKYLSDPHDEMQYVQYTSTNSLPGLQLANDSTYTREHEDDDAKFERDLEPNTDNRETGTLMTKMGIDISQKQSQIEEMRLQIESLRRDNVKLRKLVKNQAFLTFKWFM